MSVLTTEITVAAVCERDNRFLCIEEYSANRLVITQPAGHLEAGESLLEAVVRETREESGYLFDPESICGIYTWQHPRSGALILRVNFVGNASDHDPDHPLDKGIVRSLWLSREQMHAQSQRLRNPMVMQAVDDYNAGKRFDVDILTSLETAYSLNQRAG